MTRTHLDRGRRAYDRRAWQDAHGLLCLADGENALRAPDLERLGTAAFLIGRGEEFERTLDRAHRAYRDGGDRPSAARCAFWIGFRRFLRGETGPARGWFARGQRLLDEEGRETAEEGYAAGVAGIRGRGRGGVTVTERARVVVGADGLHSRVARAVAAEGYNEKAPLLAAYYSYWSGLPMAGRFEAYNRPHRAFAAWPTNDGLTLVIGGWPHAEFESNKANIEGHFLETIDLAPDFANRLRQARREERFAGMPVPGYFRKPFGPGWALVGDAGYNKDFITAQGIQDAFRDAELCVRALDDAWAGRRPWEEALAEYQTARDEHVLPMYELTADLASLEPPPPELQKILEAVHGNQDAMDGFARVNAGVTSPREFFSEEHVQRIFATARR